MRAARPWRGAESAAAQPVFDVGAAAAAPRIGSPAVARFQLGGFQVRSTRSTRLVRFLQGRMLRNEKIAVGFVNHNFVTSCQDLGCQGHDRRRLLLVNDGLGMQIAALLRFGRGFRENLNGTDFVPRFLRAVQPRPLAIYLIGATPEVVATAAAAIACIPGCHIVGFCDGYSLWDREADVLAAIAAASPDVLLVGLGNPVQERWVLRHYEQLDARVIFAVGALFDWMAGRHQRAPLLLRQLRLEWVYRLALEPRRLGRRYTFGILRFFALVAGRAVAFAPHDGAGA